MSTNPPAAIPHFPLGEALRLPLSPLLTRDLENKSMEDQPEAQARALEPSLGNAASPASRRVVLQLARLPPEIKGHHLVCYAQWDLGNMVRCCLEAGASANTLFGEEGTHVLIMAVQERAARSLKALLNGGAEVRWADEEGSTALHCAARFGDAACIALLLEAGALLEVKAHFERTPLSLAAYHGHGDAVALLLERGGDARTTDALNSTPLLLTSAQKHPHCCALLLPHSDLSITNKQGMNAFHASVATASYDCFKQILPSVADVDVRTVAGVNSDGSVLRSNQTAAHLACTKGQHKMLERLLRRGASRTARDSEQRTPLHYAAVSGQLSCIVQLIGHPEAYKLAPADIDAAEEKDGWTPLHCAAGFGQGKCCGLLIAAGARLDARSHDGYTPLMVAQEKYPTNKALHDLLAGRGPEHPPGTTCDRCGCVEDPASHLMPCSGCQVARYCSVACQRVAWEAHKTECGRLKAEREYTTRVKQVRSSAAAV